MTCYQYPELNNLYNLYFLNLHLNHPQHLTNWCLTSSVAQLTPPCSNLQNKQNIKKLDFSSSSPTSLPRTAAISNSRESFPISNLPEFPKALAKTSSCYNNSWPLLLMAFSSQTKRFEQSSWSLNIISFCQTCSSY